MKDEELVEILEDAGLSPYQAEAYVTLLALGNASATDVADACDVPDPGSTTSCGTSSPRDTSRPTSRTA